MNEKYFFFSPLIVFSIYFWMRQPEVDSEPMNDLVFSSSSNSSGELDQISSASQIQPVQFLKSEKIQLDQVKASKKWESIRKLINCAQVQECAPSLSEAKEKHFYLKEKILKDVNWFLQFHAESDELKKKSYEAAILVFQYPEEEVQYAALQWIHQLPVSQKTMDLIESEMRDVVNPNLMVLLLKEMKRFQGFPVEARSMQFLKSIFTEGSIFASRELARSIGIVLTKENYLEVNDWLRWVSPESGKYKLLSNSLLEFRRESSM
jgi:hypothetical protein